MINRMRRTLSFLVGQTSSTYFSTRLHRSTPAAQLPHCLFNNDHQIRHTNWSQLFVDSFPIHGYNTCAKDVGKGISDTGSAAGSETADQTHRTSSASRHGDQSKCCAVGTISERVQVSWGLNKNTMWNGFSRRVTCSCTTAVLQSYRYISVLTPLIMKSIWTSSVHYSHLPHQ